MFLFVLAKLLPERHNLYGNSLDFKLKYMRKKKMGHPCKKHLTFVKCVERRAFGMSPEIILRSITWREFVFHVISVIRPFLLGRT